MSQTTKNTVTISAETSVQRSKLIEFIKALGFDPNEVSRMEITPQAIYVTTYLRDASGQIYLAKEGIGNVRPATETTHVVVEDGVHEEMLGEPS